MQRMRPVDAILISDPTGTARRSIVAFDALRHQVLNRDYRSQYEAKLAMAAKHPQVWIKRLEDVADILFDTEKWFGRDISLAVDLIRRKHAEIMARTCPEGIKADLVKATKTKIDEDEGNDMWIKVMTEVKANVDAAFAESLQEAVGSLNLKAEDIREEQSFDTNMADTGQHESVEVDKTQEEISLEKIMVDGEIAASAAKAKKRGGEGQGRGSDTGPTGLSMKDAEGGEFEEVAGDPVSAESKGTKRKDVVELMKVSGGGYSRTAL